MNRAPPQLKEITWCPYDPAAADWSGDYTDIMGMVYDRSVHNLTLNPYTKLSQFLMALWKMPFKNIIGKGENAGHQHFLLFPQCFLPSLPPPPPKKKKKKKKKKNF